MRSGLLKYRIIHVKRTGVSSHGEMTYSETEKAVRCFVKNGSGQKQITDGHIFNANNMIVTFRSNIKINPVDRFKYQDEEYQIENIHLWPDGIWQEVSLKKINT